MPGMASFKRQRRLLARMLRMIGAVCIARCGGLILGVPRCMGLLGGSDLWTGLNTRRMGAVKKGAQSGQLDPPPRRALGAVLKRPPGQKVAVSTTSGTGAPILRVKNTFIEALWRSDGSESEGDEPSVVPTKSCPALSFAPHAEPAPTMSTWRMCDGGESWDGLQTGLCCMPCGGPLPAPILRCRANPARLRSTQIWTNQAQIWPRQATLGRRRPKSG